MKRIFSIFAFVLPLVASAADFVSDTFTDTDSTLLTSHTVPTGGPWIFESGSDVGRIVNNRLYFSTSDPYVIYRSTGTSSGANVDVVGRFHVMSNVGTLQIAGRVSTPGGTYTAYNLSVTSGTITLGRDPGVTLSTTSFTWTVGQDYDIRLSLQAGRKTVYVDGVPILTSTDNTVAGASGERGGIVFGGSGSTTTGYHLDSYTIGDVSDPGTTSTGSVTATTLTVSNTAATGASTPYTFRFQRAPDSSGSPGTFASIGSDQTGITTGVAPSSVGDTGLTASTTYWYRGKVTYNDGTILYTIAQSVTTSAGGMTSGTTSALATGSTTVTVSHTAASGGTAPYAYQYQRAPDSSGSPGTFANVGTQRTGVANGVAPSDLSDTGLTASTTYWYRVIATDNAAGSATSTAVSVTTNARTAATFFISAAGSDSNDGLTTSTPWLTIGKMNTTGWVPGDTLSLRGGDTFSGNLTVNPSTQPTATTSIVIGSYGTGRATINPGTSFGVKILDCGYVTLKDINITGPGLSVAGTFPDRTATSTSTAPGVIVQLTTASPYRSGITLDNLTITGCYNMIECYSSHSTPTQVFDGLRISNCTGHDCLWGGILVWGKLGNGITTRVNRYVRIEDCVVYNITGETAHSAGSGFPIVLFNAEDSIVERCLTYHVGEAENKTALNGVTGPLFAFCTRCVMRRCESYDVISPNLIDGNAFDFDADCDDCIIEYCYGHDTDSGVLLLWDADGGATSTGCIVRYNVFVNGGRRNCSNGGAGISTDGTIGSPIIHNNVFYQTFNSGGLNKLINMVNGDGTPKFYNNIFSIGGTMTFGTTTTATNFIGNVYHARSGSTFTLTVNGVGYASVSALRTGGYETLNSFSYGASGDPTFRNGGATTAIMPAAAVSTLTAYDLLTGSAARGVGVDLQRFSLTPPAVDFHGNPSISGSSASLNGIDAGPLRYGSVVPTGTSGTRGFGF